jgi:thioesterase domain-containing protein
MKDVAKAMAIRMAVYGLLVTYLGLDLFVWQGPVHSSLNQSPRDEASAIAEAKAEGVVARVYYRPIYRKQVEEAMQEFLWRRGRTVAETSPQERKTLRRLIVNRLIDDELVKLQIKVASKEEVAVSEDRVAEAMAVEMSRYPGEGVFAELAERAGWSGEKEREMRLAARIQRADHLARMTDVSVSDEEVGEWFEANREKLTGSLAANRERIRDALRVVKRDEAWKRFRVAKLRRYADGKIDLFEDVLFAEDE